MHGMIEEIIEGETKKLCCHLDSNLTLTSLKWLKGNKTVIVTQDVNQTCHTIKSVSRYDQANYTCIAENVIGSGSVTVALKVKCKLTFSAINIRTLEGFQTYLSLKSSLNLNISTLM